MSLYDELIESVIYEDKTEEYKNRILLRENIIKSINDFDYNLDSFISGNCNILFITGFSGSGKSTMSKEYSKLYNAEIIELDNLGRALKSKESLNQSSKIIIDFYNSKEGKKYLNDSYSEIKNNWNIYENIIIDFLNWFLNNKYNINKKYIIEGIQIMTLLNNNKIMYELVKNNSLILKGESNLESIKRSALRDYNKKVLRNEIDDNSFNKLLFLIKHISRALKYIKFNNNNFNNIIKLF